MAQGVAHTSGLIEFAMMTGNSGMHSQLIVGYWARIGCCHASPCNVSPLSLALSSAEFLKACVSHCMAITEHTTETLWQSVLNDYLQKEQVGTDDRSGIVLMA